MKNYYPVNMKILGTHFQIVSNECTNYQNDICIYLLEYAWTNWCQQTGTDRQADEQTDRVKPI